MPLSRVRTLVLICLLPAAGLLAGCGGGGGNNEALDEIRSQQREILARLGEIEKKLERSARPASARASGPNPERAYELPVGGSPVKGPEHAPVTIVEFSDYQCPFCARSEGLVQQALAAYPTQVRLAFKHYPLTSIHPQAMDAALAAVAAQRQGRFWEMHEKLFANQRALGRDQLLQYARELGLDLPRFEADLASPEVKAQVTADIQLARRAGVRGTPTIFVNGRLLQNRSLEGFKELIEPQLKAAAAATPAAAGS